MSNRSNGFSQDEICTINSKMKPVRKTSSGTVRKHVSKKSSDLNNVDNLAKNDQKTTRENATSAADTANLSESTLKAFHEALHYQPLDNSSKQRINNSSESPTLMPSNGRDIDTGSEQTAQPNDNNNYAKSDLVSGQLEQPLFRGVSLKDFEQHQQMMKEANLEKRKLLGQAIEKRFEQSTAETKKIAKIREELDKLDQELAVDVEILGKEIETVTLQYTSTKEHYHQIESQFLAAKLNLYQISEKKELLTEHLCTIISHNEDRKAKRLSELLDKVGLSTKFESSEENGDGNSVCD